MNFLADETLLDFYCLNIYLFPSRSVSRSELLGGSDTNEGLKKTTRKKKEKKKKHHHHKKVKKKTREESSYSESESDAEYGKDKPVGSDRNCEREASSLKYIHFI